MAWPSARIGTPPRHALGYFGQDLANFAIEVPNPMILVEVLSPATRHIAAPPRAFLGG
jgi:hypothetical protein